MTVLNGSLKTSIISDVPGKGVRWLDLQGVWEIFNRACSL